MNAILRTSHTVHAARCVFAAFAASLLVGCATGETAPVTAVGGQSSVVSNSASATNAPLASTNLPPEAVADITNVQQLTVIQAEPPQFAPPEGVKVTPGIESVLKMVQSGVGEEAILAYVTKTPAEYNLDAETIVYLTDLGVSSAVIAVMLNNDTALDPNKKNELAQTADTNAPTAAPEPPPATAAALPAGNPQPQAPVAEQSLAAEPQLGNGYVAAPVDPAAAAQPLVTQQTVVAAQPQVIYTTPPAEVVQNYFYSPLQPYGSWVYVGSYGWSWRPTVAVYDPFWRPYHTRGRWVWSNHGWYWQSDYSWGWAAFHYGRWSCPPGVGWVWTPDYTWGPAWVSWRRSDAYCGWAPLPPRAHWRSGFGFSYYDRHVGVSFDFGLHHDHYTFVRARDFCDPHPWRRSVPRHERANVYNNTTVVNNYIVGNNNTIINNGVGHDFVAANARSEIRKVTVQERPDLALDNRPGRGATIAPDRITKVGSDMVVYRPTPPPVTPAAASGPAPITARGEPIRTATPGARFNSRDVSRLNSDIASRPNAVAVTPSQRPAAVGSNRGPASVPQPGALSSRPTSVPGSSPTPAVRGSEPIRREVATRPDAAPSTRIGSGLVNGSTPSTRPGSVASAPQARPSAAPSAAPSNDALGQRLREVRREGITTRAPTATPTPAPRSIGSLPGSAPANNISRPAAPPASVPSVRSETPVRRIEPIRTPAPIAQRPAQTYNAPTTRPAAPIATPQAQAPDSRGVAPRYPGGARSIMNQTPAPVQNARTYTAPAPIVSQPVAPVTPAYRAQPIQRPIIRQESAPSYTPRFSNPPNSPAPVVRSAPVQPSYNPPSAPQIRQSAPVIRSQPQAPSQPAFQSRPSSPAPSSPAQSSGPRTPGSFREQIQR